MAERRAAMQWEGGGASKPVCAGGREEMGGTRRGFRWSIGDSRAGGEGGKVDWVIGSAESGCSPCPARRVLSVHAIVSLLKWQEENISLEEGEARPSGFRYRGGRRMVFQGNGIESDFAHMPQNCAGVRALFSACEDAPRDKKRASRGDEG
eukprot:2609134-Pleurochrysis_carterae.AAC.1